jgi:hypothetical protein
MTQLELILRETELEFPHTPDLVAAVAPRLREGRPDTWTREAGAGPARERGRIWRPGSGRRSLALALAALLLVAGGAVAAIPGLRDPVLDWLGLTSAKVERVPATPDLPRRAPGADLGLGDRTTLSKARAELGFEPLLPRGLGQRTVYTSAFAPGGMLSLVYRDGKLLLTELRGRLRSEFFRKFVGPSTRIDRVRVAGEPGIWIAGAPHGLIYMTPDGEIRQEASRLAGPTLLWRRGDLLLRLEGARSKTEALRIAGSVR